MTAIITDNGDGTCTAILDDPIQDGTVYNSGSDSGVAWEDLRNTIGKDVENTVLNIGKRTGSVHRSYVEWDVSSIPDTATILDAVFHYEGEYQIDSEIWDFSRYAPSASQAQLIWKQIEAGREYTTPGTFPVSGHDKSVDLGPLAEDRLEKQLTYYDWFAIGFKSSNENLESISWIKSEESSDADPVPTLEVMYTPTPLCGNGLIEGSEACDDRNTNNGDGCSSSCQIESGYVCRGEPSQCWRSTEDVR